MKDTPAAWVPFDQIAWFVITLTPALQTTKHLGGWDAHPVTARSAKAHSEGILDHVLYLQSPERAVSPFVEDCTRAIKQAHAILSDLA